MSDSGYSDVLHCRGPIWVTCICRNVLEMNLAGRAGRVCPPKHEVACLVLCNSLGWWVTQMQRVALYGIKSMLGQFWLRTGFADVASHIANSLNATRILIFCSLR